MSSRDELVALDDRYVWHPFTPHSVYRDEDPLMVVAGEGNYLIDANGERYLDGVSSLWCNLFGHRHPRIDAAIEEQLGKIAHATFLGNASAAAVTLAQRLVELAPEPLSRVFYSDNGSTAVEIALKMAYQYWQQADGGSQRQRTTFLTLDNAYHGDTVGSVSLGGIDLFHARYGPLLFEAPRAPSPYCYRCPLGLERSSCELACVQEMERLIYSHGSNLAAVFMEPGVQGAAGMITQPEGMLQRIRAATERVGALLILDEVAVGFGRSAQTMFYCESQGVAPDMMCLAKGLTGGYLPMAATLTTEPIYQAFLAPPEQGNTFFHGHTYTGNALAAAAAHATLDIFEAEAVLESLPEKAQHLSAQLERLGSLPGVGDVRQMGLAAGIELVMDRGTRATYNPAERRGMRVCRAALQRGLFLRPLGDVVVLMPPLSITLEELTGMVDVLDECIREVLSDAC